MSIFAFGIIVLLSGAVVVQAIYYTRKLREHQRDAQESLTSWLEAAKLYLEKNEALIIALHSNLDEEGKKVVEARFGGVCTCAISHGQQADAWHCPRHGIQIPRLP